MKPLPHTQPFFAHPLAQLAVAFALGILGERFVSSRIAPVVLVGVFLGMAASIAALRHKLMPASAFLTLAFTLTGACLAQLEKRQVRSDGVKALIERSVIAVAEPVELTGVLSREPETAPNRLYLTLSVEGLKYKGHAHQASGVIALTASISSKTVAEEYQRLNLRYGARIRLKTALKRSDDYRNPGVSSFTEFLDRKGFDATGFIKSPLFVERLPDDRSFAPLAWLYQWRRQVEAQIRYLFSSESAAVLNASLLGNRHYLSRQTAERFREGGTFHVLVISGWHISVIGASIFLITRRFTKQRGWQFVLSTTVLWSYALAVGAESSVVRAAIMFTLYTLAPVLGRHGGSVNTLGATALLLLVWQPSSLFDPSFQLTFLSVTAIIILAWPLLAKLSAIGLWRPTRETPYPPSCALWLRSFAELLFWREQEWKKELSQLNYSYGLVKNPTAVRLEHLHLQRFLRYAFASVVVSLCVQVLLLPLMVVYFHRVSISALILNVGVSVIMALVSLTAIASLIVAQISVTLAEPLVTFTNALNWLMIHSVDPFAQLGISSFRLPQYVGWKSSIYVLYYVPLVFLAGAISGWNPFEQTALKPRKLTIPSVALIALTIAALIVFHPFSTTSTNGRLQVDFLDVGQGDAALVTMPNGTTLLVDGGGRADFFRPKRERGLQARGEESFEFDRRAIGEAVVSEYLWWRGLDRVDYLLATHMDADHVNGLSDVLRNFLVRSVLVARTPETDPEFGQLRNIAGERNVPLQLIGSGAVLTFGDIHVRVLWPRPSAKLPSRNNDSVVVRIEYGERRILLTGDLERRGESTLLALQRANTLLRADVVKVPHHGSKSSSTEAFVKATSARFAIISVGRTSIFGHPHKEVVERWEQSGAKVLTTGKSGMITVTTDGEDLQVKTFVSDQL